MTMVSFSPTRYFCRSILKLTLLARSAEGPLYTVASGLFDTARAHWGASALGAQQSWLGRVAGHAESCLMPACTAWRKLCSACTA